MSQVKRTGIYALTGFVFFASLFVSYRLYSKEGVEARSGGGLGEILETPEFVILSPQDNQVFQRSTERGGDVVVKIRFSAPVNKHVMVRAAYGSGSWQKVSGGEVSGNVFSGVLKGQPVGRETLRIKVYDSVKIVWGVSVGDVFVPIGQSNAAGGFTHPNKLAGGTRFSPVAFVGGKWVPCEDPINPYAVVLAGSGELNGSVWPLVAQMLAEKNNGVPVAFVDVSMAATGLVYSWPVGSCFEGLTWKDEDPYFRNAVDIISAATSGSNRIRALLWLQGESDVMGGVLADQYKAGLVDLVLRMRRDLSQDLPPFLVGQIAKIYQYGSVEAVDGIRRAQREIVDNNTFFSGPDGALVPLGADQLHFRSEEAASLLASLWVESIESLPPLPSESNEHKIVASK